MTSLRVEWDGGSAEFPVDQVVKVGRAVDCDVKLTDSHVSRIHLFLEFRGGVWVLTDRSSSGTFSNGTKFTEASIPDAQAIRLGAPDGPELRLTPVDDTTAPWVASSPESSSLGSTSPHPAPPAPAGAGTPPPAAAEPIRPAPPAGAPPPPDAPAAPGHAGLPAMTVTIGDQLLRLRPEGSPERVFPPRTPIVVGRDPDCEIVIDDPLVSRHHVKFDYDGSHWYFEDLGSSRGTYFDGSRTKGRTRAEGAFSLWLGGIDAGAELGVITAGEHRVHRSRLPIVLAGAVLLVLIVAVAALALRSDGNGGGESALPPVEGLANSVVLVAEFTDEGDLCARGSGSVLDNGLILTNFHVIAQQEFRNEDGDTVVCGADLAVLAGDGRDAVPDDQHPVEVLVADPELDLAVLRVTDDFPYEPVELGNSADVQSGDAVRVLGYPGIGGGTLTVTDGIVSGFESDDGVGDRGWFKTDTWIASGNSGGSAFDRAGKLIGVPTQGRPDVRCSNDECATIGNINLLRPIDLAIPLIRQAGSATPIPFGDRRLDASLLDE